MAELNTEERILAAAKKVFHQKGLGGARMKDIAEEAEINKAMLHYYFRSKDLLFQKVFDEAFGQILPAILRILNNDMPIRKKVEEIADFYIRTLSENPELPVFVLNAIQYDPEQFLNRLVRDMDVQPQQIFMKLMTLFQAEVQAGEIEPIDPRHFLLNLVSMSIFPFMMKPMLKILLQINDEQFLRLMQDRKEVIPEVMMASIKK